MHLHDSSILKNFFFDFKKKYICDHSNLKLKLLDNAYNSVFDGDYFNTSTSVDLDKIISIDNIDSAISFNIFSGSNILDEILNNIFDESIFIVDSLVLPFLRNHKQIKISDNKVFDINSIETGAILSNIIKNVEKNKPKYLVGIGGGRTMDYLKFISMKTEIYSIGLPTSLSSHVYASPKIHALKPIQELGYKLTIDGNACNLSFLDISVFEELYEKNPRLLYAGFGDISAFYTASLDWRLSIEKKQATQNEFVDDVINYILTKLEDINIELPLDTWIQDYFLMQALLCYITDWVGSAPASGSEHLFALCVEKYPASLPLHGELVALGVLIFLSIHDKSKLEKVKEVLLSFGLPLSISKIGITKQDMLQALVESENLGKRKNRYTIINSLDATTDYYNKKLEYLFNNNIILD